eukprot:gene30195-34082_t
MIEFQHVSKQYSADATALRNVSLTVNKGELVFLAGPSGADDRRHGASQQMLQGKVYQMLRLTLDEGMGAIPEISANKYMLWVRFTTQGGDLKPKPLEEDVPFELTL